MVKLLAQVPGVVTSFDESVGVPQLSVAVAVANDGVAGHSIVDGAGGAAGNGAELSASVIVCDAVVALPQASVAVHVLVMVKLLAQVPGVVTSFDKSVGVPQLSVAVAVANDGVAGHSIVDGAGSAAITGAVLSTTVIDCDAVVALPQASVAVHVLVMVKLLAQVPGVVTSFEVSVGVPQLSVAVAVANDGVAGHSIVDGAGGAAIAGAVLSTTVIDCDAVVALPQASVAVHVLVMVKLLAQVPGVVTSFDESVGVPQLSVAVAVANDGVAGHSIVDGAGSAAITGAVLSTTVIDCDAVVALPQASVAVHVLVMVKLLAQVPGVVTSFDESVGVPQLSVAVAVANDGVAGHSIVDGAGRAAITGAVLSTTVIDCDAVVALPQASVAVHVLVMVKLLAQVPGVVTSFDVSV